VKPKFTLDTIVNVDLNGNKKLPGAFLVMVIAPGGVQRSMTYHHPIGYTNLSADEWVCTPTNDVADLLLRAVHPEEETVKKNRGKFRIEMAQGCDPPLLKMVGTNLCYPNGENRRDALSAAEAARKAYRSGLSKKDLEKDRKTAVEFLSQELQTAERALNNFYKSKECVKACEEKYPYSPYETCSGVLADRKQVASWVVGKTTNEAVDIFGREIAIGVDDPVYQPGSGGSSGNTTDPTRGRSKTPSRRTPSLMKRSKSARPK
jgi:Rad3-related DNA helicase